MIFRDSFTSSTRRRGIPAFRLQYLTLGVSVYLGGEALENERSALRREGKKGKGCTLKLSALATELASESA